MFFIRPTNILIVLPYTKPVNYDSVQVSRFLVNSLGEAEPPRGISRAHTLYTLAKQVWARSNPTAPMD